MRMPEIVSQDEWTIAREALGDKEQAAAASHSELAAERRRMPMVRVDKEYRFDGPMVRSRCPTCSTADSN